MIKEILEIFNTKINCKWKNNKCKFLIDNDLIEIEKTYYDKNILDFSFYRNGEQLSLNLNKNSFRILGAVKNILFDAIEKENPEFIIITSSDNHIKRNALYKKLVDEIAKKFNYKVKSVNEFIPKGLESWIIYKNDLEKIKNLFLD
jgi:hypothetical protein